MQLHSILSEEIAERKEVKFLLHKQTGASVNSLFLLQNCNMNTPVLPYCCISDSRTIGFQLLFSRE